MSRPLEEYVIRSPLSPAVVRQRLIDAMAGRPQPFHGDVAERSFKLRPSFWYLQRGEIVADGTVEPAGDGSRVAVTIRPATSQRVMPWVVAGVIALAAMTVEVVTAGQLGWATVVGIAVFAGAASLMSVVGVAFKSTMSERELRWALTTLLDGMDVDRQPTR